MPLIINGQVWEDGKPIIINGVTLEEIKCNGVTVWVNESTVDITLPPHKEKT